MTWKKVGLSETLDPERVKQRGRQVTDDRAGVDGNGDGPFSHSIPTYMGSFLTEIPGKQIATIVNGLVTVWQWEE